MDIQDRPVGTTTGHRFTPASMDQFFRYAKNVAWLLEMKLQRSQELLAKAYGFSGLHEIAEWMKGGHPPGPYSSSDDALVEEMTWCSPQRADAALSLRRSHRLLDLVRDYKGDGGDGLEKRHRLILELGLFARPAAHAQLARGVRSLLEEGVGGSRGDGAPVGVAAFMRYWFHREGEFEWPQSTPRRPDGSRMNPVQMYGDPRHHEQILSAKRWSEVASAAGRPLNDKEGTESSVPLQPGAVTVLTHSSAVYRDGAHFDGFGHLNSSTLLTLEAKEGDATGELCVWNFETIYWLSRWGASTQPQQIIGVMRGWHVCPTDGAGLPSMATALATMDSCSNDLATRFSAVNRVADRTIGYSSVLEMMGCRRAGAFTAVTEMHIDPGFSRRALAGMMIELFRWSTFNAPYGALDAGWRANLAGWLKGDRGQEFTGLDTPEDADAIRELCGAAIVTLDAAALLADLPDAEGKRESSLSEAASALSNLRERGPVLLLVDGDTVVTAESLVDGNRGSRQTEAGSYLCPKCSTNLVPKLTHGYGGSHDALVSLGGSAGCRGLRLECEDCDFEREIELELCSVEVDRGKGSIRNGRDYLEIGEQFAWCPECLNTMFAEWDDERLQFDEDPFEKTNDYEYVEGGYMRLLGRCRGCEKPSVTLLFKVRRPQAQRTVAGAGRG